MRTNNDDYDIWYYMLADVQQGVFGSSFLHGNLQRGNQWSSCSREPEVANTWEFGGLILMKLWKFW